MMLLWRFINWLITVVKTTLFIAFHLVISHLGFLKK